VYGRLAIPGLPTRIDFQHAEDFEKIELAGVFPILDADAIARA